MQLEQSTKKALANCGRDPHHAES